MIPEASAFLVVNERAGLSKNKTLIIGFNKQRYYVVNIINFIVD